MANPRRRRVARRSSKRRSRRSVSRFRRNPVSLRASVSSVTNALTNAAIGGAGAVGVDMLMGQTLRFLPEDKRSKLLPDGSANWLYHGVKLGVAIGVGVLGAKMLPGKLKGYAVRAAEGSLTVQAYELTRAHVVPATWTMGAYANPAAIVNQARSPNVGAYLPLNRSGSMRAYQPMMRRVAMRGSSGYGGSVARGGIDQQETRIGEGAVI